MTGLSEYNPNDFIISDGGDYVACRRCGLAVHYRRAHHEWHVALDAALADAGATRGTLTEVSRLRVDR